MPVAIGSGARFISEAGFSFCVFCALCASCGRAFGVGTFFFSGFIAAVLSFLSFLSADLLFFFASEVAVLLWLFWSRSLLLRGS